ncbi:MAG: DUF1223 domain-containing protein [Opitutae bacterium]|nr:DUF1223 domain-containing protein [Opitutae bacterium]
MLLIAATASAEPQKFSSGETKTRLIELYTSEGCSSCPPAEAWLGTLREAPGLWRDFVPVAFHVVYWDRLGWKDRFASQAGTEREYAYASAWGSGSVYTPCFVQDGAEWRESFGRRAPAPATEKTGVLAVECGEDGACRVTFAPAAGAGRGEFEVHVAQLGGGISSDVRSGENGGLTLRHEFVALSLQSTRLVTGAAELALTPVKVAGVTRRALAVWVTRRGELTPVQATGGWWR